MSNLSKSSMSNSFKEHSCNFAHLGYLDQSNYSLKWIQHNGYLVKYFIATLNFKYLQLKLNNHWTCIKIVFTCQNCWQLQSGTEFCRQRTSTRWIVNKGVRYDLIWNPQIKNKNSELFIRAPIWIKLTVCVSLSRIFISLIPPNSSSIVSWFCELGGF